MVVHMTIGENEHDVVFDCIVNFYRGRRATMWAPEEPDEYEITDVMVCRINEVCRSEQPEWFRDADQIIEGMIDSGDIYDEIIDRFIASAEPEWVR